MIEIWVIDDDAALREALSGALSRRGFVVQTFESAEAALNQSSITAPYGAVLDLKMGGISGLEAITPLREHWPDVKIVILTGYASLSTAVEAIKAGAVHYLPKPSPIEDILSALELTAQKPKVAPAHKTTSLKTQEWEQINATLAETGYNISETARRLGLHRRTLARKLAKRPIS